MMEDSGFLLSEVLKEFKDVVADDTYISVIGKVKETITAKKHEEAKWLKHVLDSTISRGLNSFCERVNCNDERLE